MKYLLLVCVTLVALHYGNAYQDQIEGECGQEFMRIFTTSQGCTSGYGYSVFKIDETLAKAATGEIGKNQVRRYLTNICRYAQNDTTCIRNIQSNEACEDSSVVKLALNMNTVIETQVSYMCSNAPGADRPRYLDWVRSDGLHCAAANQALKFCMKANTDQLGIDRIEEVLKADMCALLKTHNDCAYLYGLCRNKKVKEYMGDVLEMLNEKYNCSPDV